MDNAEKKRKEEERVILNATMLMRNPTSTEYFAFITQNTLGKSRYEPLSAEDLFYYKFIETMEFKLTDSPQIPTAGVTLTGKTKKPYVVYMNREFAMTLTPEEVYAVIKHELAHIIHLHTDMLKNYEKNVSKYLEEVKKEFGLEKSPKEILQPDEIQYLDNIASDAQINGLSKENPIISNLPGFAVYYESLLKQTLKHAKSIKKLMNENGVKNHRLENSLNELEKKAERLLSEKINANDIESIPLFKLIVAYEAVKKELRDLLYEKNPNLPPQPGGTPAPGEEGTPAPGGEGGTPHSETGSGDGGENPRESEWGQTPDGEEKETKNPETGKENGREKDSVDESGRDGEKDSPQKEKEERDSRNGAGGEEPEGLDEKEIEEKTSEAAKKTSGGSDRDLEDMVSKMNDEEKRKTAGIPKEEWDQMSEEEKKKEAEEAVKEKVKKAVEKRRSYDEPMPIDSHGVEEQIMEIDEMKEIIEDVVAKQVALAEETVREEVNNGNARGTAPAFASELIKAKANKPKKKKAFPSLKKVLEKMASSFMTNMKGRNKKKTRPFEISLLGNKRTKMTGENVRGKEEQKLPPVYVLVDTSGSMDKKDLEEAIQELINITKGTKIPVYMIPVDAEVYGEPFELTPSFDFKKGVDLFGRGGTKMSPGIVKALEHAYLTDSVKNNPNSKIPVAKPPRDKYGEPPSGIGIIILTDGGTEKEFDLKSKKDTKNGKTVDYEELAKERLAYLGIALTGEYKLFLDLKKTRQKFKKTKVQVARWSPSGMSVDKKLSDPDI